MSVFTPAEITYLQSQRLARRGYHWAGWPTARHARVVSL